MQSNMLVAVLVLLVYATACEPRDDAAVADSPRATPAPDTGRIVDSTMVQVAVLDPRDEESGIGGRVVSAPAGRAPMLRSDTLFADATAVAAAIGADTSITLERDRVSAGGRRLDVRGFRARGGVYVPVRSFSRALGAFTYPERDANGVRIYPRPVLEWLLANRENPDEVAVLRGAREEGLLPPRD
jgi:hypothetical protein